MSVGNLLNGLHLTGNAIDMGSQDGGGLGSDGGFDLGWVYRESVGKNIHEYGGASFPYDAGGSGHVGKRGGDDLSFQVQGFDGELERDSTVADEEQVVQA